MLYLFENENELYMPYKILLRLNVLIIRLRLLYFELLYLVVSIQSCYLLCREMDKIAERTSSLRRDRCAVEVKLRK